MGWASSETVLGLPFDVPPPYAPLDEEYPVLPNSTYSLGKAVEEEMARHFARWNPELSIVGLRFSNVMEPADYQAFPAWQHDPSHSEIGFAVRHMMVSKVRGRFTDAEVALHLDEDRPEASTVEARLRRITAGTESSCW